MKLFRWAAAAVALASALISSANAQLNTQLVSQLTLGSDSEPRDISGDGRYLYVARGSAGLDIIDAINPAAPVKVGNVRPFPGSGNIDMEDVEVFGNIAYVANHIPNGAPTPWVGVFMYDVSNPAAPVEVGRIEWGAGAWYHLGANAHNLCIAEASGSRYAYIASITTSTVQVFDVTNPAAPVYLSYIEPPRNTSGFFVGEAHEIHVHGNLCFTTWLNGGFAIHDVTNPAAPVLVSHMPYVNAYTLDAFTTDDGRYLCTTDGRTSIGLRIWDITNPTAPLLAGSYTSGRAMMHNVVVRGKYAYLSHFRDGLRVVNIENPVAPRIAAWYDTDPASAATDGKGAWGVYPGLDTIFVSDTTRGLLAVDFVDSVSITSADWYRRTRRLVVTATSTAAPGATLEVAGYGTMTYNVSNSRYELNAAAPSQPRDVTVNSDLGGSATRRTTKR